MRVLRVYHCGRDPGHRDRDRVLSTRCELNLVVPAFWPDTGSQRKLSAEQFPIVELAVERSGDVNRHRYGDPAILHRLVQELRPDVIDLHEEPFSVAARQWLSAAGDVPVVMYTAQNLDKRFPPPFHQYERSALRRVTAFYPCSRQAASVIRGKGYAGMIRVVPLGYDDSLFLPGRQSADDDPLVLSLIGRLVPEKGVLDAIHVLHAVRRDRKATLRVIGQGPEEASARRLAERLGLADAVEFYPWAAPRKLAEHYRDSHVVLVPSRATSTWVEQFGRVIVEAQASGAVVAGYASGSIPEVAAGEAGDALLVSEGAVSALGEAVSALLNDADFFTALRRQGQQTAQTRAWGQVAAAQLDLYHEAVRGGCVSSTTGRAAAVAEFGPPATALGQDRPFALPLLRRPSPVSRTLGTLLDRLP